MIPDLMTSLWHERAVLVERRNQLQNLRQLVVSVKVQCAINSLTEAIGELAKKELAAHGPVKPLPLP